VTVPAENPLRQTIVASGPIDLESMFETGTRFITDVTSALTGVVGNRSGAVIRVLMPHRSLRSRSGHQRRMVPTRVAKRTQTVARASIVANRARSRVAGLSRLGKLR
jgi:hypothetical protein